ncbi:MAG: FecR family protein [Bacteroidota bacterium]
MMNKEKFILLLDKYTLDDISPEERSEFLAAATSGIYDDLVLQHIEKKLRAPNATIEGANLPPHRSADILHKILSSEKQNSTLIPKVSVRMKIIRWTVAAAVISAVSLGAYILSDTENVKPGSNAAFANNMLEKVNVTVQPLKIQMEEGSIITLQPGSSIHYPSHFLPDKREIFLEGEAFFEVSKNASRPFFVYNNNIVTHVLGTSFNVKMNRENKQVEVSVRSGRVEVYEDKPAVKATASKKNNGVILSPNQKVTYDQDTRQFVPSLVDVPLPIINEMSDKNVTPETAVFESTPLKTVLSSLERSYGIDIVVETENIYKCLFTGDVSQQDLYTRLDVICQSVQALYEVKGTKILIKGKGCN